MQACKKSQKNFNKTVFINRFIYIAHKQKVFFFFTCQMKFSHDTMALCHINVDPLVKFFFSRFVNSNKHIYIYKFVQTIS